MNLKHKLTHKTTATIQLLTDTSCIFSDEVSTSHDCLSIIEAPSKAELWNKIQQLSIAHASSTRFQPIINLITLNKELKVIKINDPNKQPTKIINSNEYKL